VCCGGGSERVTKTNENFSKCEKKYYNIRKNERNMMLNVIVWL